MKRWMLIGVVMAAALGGLAAAAVLIGAGRGLSVFTDGREIRAAARGAPVRQILWQPARPVAGAVSSTSDEYEPRVSADGTVMVFVRGRPGANAELFESRWREGAWSEPAAIASVNTAADELGPCLSADGQWLYFYSDRAGGQGGFDLYRARRAEAAGERTVETWGEAVNLGPAVNTPFNEYGPALSPDAATLYFSSNRPRPGEAVVEPEGWPATVREVRGRHDYDLYESAMADGGPGEAIALTELNTPSDEGAPAVSPAGDFLYFASDRAGGLGGFDLHRVRIAVATAGAAKDKPADVRRFGAVEPLGPAVNSGFNDLDPALSADGFRLVFSSDRPVEGAGPADYGLWWTVSREVYREADWSAARAAWEKLWPWLLLLLASLIGAALLARFARRAGWGSRHGTLGLLARCMIFSFALHLVVASLLAVWRVGSTIGELMRDGGGAGRGVRVALTSTGTSGGVAGQIRAGLGDGPALEPTPISPLRASAPALEMLSSAAMVAPEVHSARERSRLELAVRDAEVGESSARPEPAPAMSVMRLEAGLPESRAAAPTTEAAARAPAEAAAAPSARAPVVTAQIDGPARASVEVPAGASGDRAEALPVELAEQSAADTGPAMAGAMPVPSPEQAGPGVGLPSATAAAAPRSEAGSGSAEPGPPMAANPRAGVITGNLGQPGRAQVEVQLPGPARDGAAAIGSPIASSAAKDPDAFGRPGVDAAGLPAVAGTQTSADLALPSAPAAAARGDRASEPGGASIGNLLGATATPRADLGQLSGSDKGRGGGPAKIEVKQGSSTGDSAARLDLGIGESALADGGSGDQARAAFGAIPLPGGSGESLTLGLPDVGAQDAPPAPVETFAQRDPDPEVRGEMLARMGGSRETERAVSLALRWLAAHQETDGRWSGQHFDDHCGACGGPAEIDSDTAITGMALLCYLGAGHTHRGDGEHRATVEKAINWLKSREAGRGDLRRNETMYAQTIATVALCEALAMTGDAELAGPARRAVRIVMDVSARGGRGTADTSVLGWQVMAVESARRAGIAVDGTTFTAAERFLDRVEQRPTPGRYAYEPNGRASPAMTAEAMFVRQLVGHGREEPRMRESARFILGTPPKWKAGAPTHYWYYATLALFQQQGEAWRAWNEALVPELLSSQAQTGPAVGSWEPQDEWSRLGGRIYQTAVCTLSLEVYYRYRPAGLKIEPGADRHPE